eukprot:3659160-Pyramimonas_sp.AAC.1
MKPSGLSFGNRGRPSGGLLKAVLSPLGDCFGASSGPLGGLLRPLGRFFGHLEAFMASSSDRSSSRGPLG